MTDFDRNEYWKGRAMTKITSLFEDVKTRLKDIRNDVEHISGGKNQEFFNAVMYVGDGFDMMKEVVDKIGLPKPVPQVPAPASPVEVKVETREGEVKKT